ncbi:MAG: HAD family hydrolase [Phycisphaerales bacterium]|nr:MAG: HAD family hydrolase [Phycisphaerales bacterium]
MSDRPFDGILIDFYGTISDGDRDAVEAVCGRVVKAHGLTLSPREFAEAWGEVFFGLLGRSNHHAFKTLYQCELQSLRDTLASFGTGDGNPQRFVAEIEKYWVDPPVHHDALDFLSRLDLPVCCVSNADTEPLLAAIEKHGLRFDAVVTSQDARCYKPDPHIFEKALGALGATPQRTLHIGDSLHSDVGGASKLGISTAWIRRENRIHDIGTSRPDHILGALTDIIPLLR